MSVRERLAEMTCAECIDSLGSYLDGELLPEEAAVIGEHIEACADCAAAHRRLVATSSQLKNGLTRYQAPDVLKARIRAALAQPEVESKVRYAQVTRFRDFNRRRTITAAAVVAVVRSAVTLSVVDRKPAGETVQSELLSSHIRSLMPGHLTDVASYDQHNVKPWFNGRVDMSPNVPRLDSL